MASIFSRRVVSYVLDFIVVSAIMWILSYLVFLVMGPSNVYTVYQYLPYSVPFLIWIYFILTEKFMGASIGKAIMNLEVRSNNGARISWPQAIVRNITKIYWIPIIFDWLVGKLLKTDRVLNNITRTVVINAR